MMTQLEINRAEERQLRERELASQQALREREMAANQAHQQALLMALADSKPSLAASTRSPALSSTS